VQELHLRIQAVQAGTTNANIELSYCADGEQQASDVAIDHDDFVLYIDQNSQPALKNAVIDYKQDVDTSLAKLHIKAPFLKYDASGTDKSNSEQQDLFMQIKIFLEQNINPSLARHNGMVKLQEIKPNQSGGIEVILQFGGGCKGCSMINFTLKQGIEKSLREKFPEVTLITDATDHASGENPYLK
jgi:Fe/S biogenesis protein NfuA